ncbi:hypothetical protein AJ79_06075 [Helicocarpus griseus UAMH5409]|uniref:aldehyde dehydrogenase (NAD(+)) n=1 Tax=Helicocarpus griseus UAMH5409 TaxID=1447875 RepID=A0A2B7XGM2_9EURO|nr:hypothetical protein AJ79_06075 [Helicocarpus griseus UAMH5409]
MAADAPKLDFTTFHNVINNELVSTATTRHSINPANRQPNPEVPVSTQEDLDKAVAAAKKAFKAWSKTTFEERRTALCAFADALDANKDGFAKTLTMEQGKPLAQSYQEIGMATTWLRTIPTQTLPEEVLEDTEDRKIIHHHVPMGVACGIVPWNYPILLACGKIAPALYTGNTLIVKPSPFTPYCDLKLGELATKFFPPGVLQVLSGGDDLGPMMTAHPGIDKVSFTGSSMTGKKVMASCAATLKRVTLELGGNDPAIICEDVDIDAIIPKIAILSFLCSSQICMMIKRIYVHEKIYDQFLDAFVKFTKTLKSGEGNEPDVFFGPVQNSMQYEKVKDLFTSIEGEGLKPVLGGKIEESDGYFITPTVIDNPPEKSRVVTEEPFGPIVPFMKWSDEDDVIARANDTQMGLGSSVWSKDTERAARIARQLESGSVWVNSHFDVAPGVPFGGHKWSGIGMEWGITGLKAYCNPQTLWLKKSL